eukprot:scaffold34848_cov90-Isochrysis_galbana.AAC.1
MALPQTNRMSETKPEALEYWFRFSLSWMVPEGGRRAAGVKRGTEWLLRSGGGPAKSRKSVR